MNAVRGILRLLLGRRLPVLAGTVRVSGAGGPVTVRRDRYGIPYIEAESDADAWFGLGFCHGQDRAFQLEQIHRLVRGTLCELVGPAALPIDRLSRRIGFAYSSAQQWEVLDDEIRRMLEAYTAGVNQGIERGCPRPAHEFALLRGRPTPFRPVDVLGMCKLLSFSLPGNWDVELARFRILSEDGAEALRALDPAYPEWQTVTSPPATPAGPAADRLAEDLALLAAMLGHGGGSNNWVIAPGRTATGRALLANDGHLGPSLPSYTYLASVKTPRWNMVGVTFIGTPVFAMGHNGTLAWGITAGLTDNTDFFIEQPGPDGRSVRQGDGFVPCPVRRETINVKGRPPLEEAILMTPRGPIVSPVIEGETDALSLSAVWLQPRPIQSLFRLHRARTVEEFRGFFKQWPALPLNLVFADSSGNIGWQLAGEAPQRRKGRGTIPLPGYDPEAGWLPETVPFELMPRLDNPPIGFIATANNRPTREEDRPFLGVDWLDGYRVTRITEALTARRDWDPAGALALQLDQVSLPWRELRDIILAAPPLTVEAGRALELLRSWDGVMAADSPAAAVFEFFFAEMAQRLARLKAPRSWRWALCQGATALTPASLLSMRRFGHLVRLLRARPDGWLPGPWPEEIADALAAAVKALEKRRGRDSARWAWGRVRPLTLKHPVGEQRPLDRVFNLGPFPWGGDGTTVGQAAPDPLDPAGNPLFIAAIRLVIDVGNWDENSFSLPGGQSGNPFSPHYGDLLPFWRQGKGVPIYWSPDKVEKAAVSRLRLEPV